jgi:predicted dehydrogenase
MKALVIGYGVMGKHHARTLRRLGAEVQTLDPSRSAGADHQMLTEDLVAFAQVACIATPAEDLARVAALWLARGVDVMVEKPMALDLDQARVLLQAELASDAIVRIGYLERWNPAVLALREHLHLVGTIRHVTGQRLGLAPRNPAVGPELDLLTHDIDVLRFLGLWPRILHAAHDGAHVTASFALPGDGAHATLQASHLHPLKQRSLSVVGDEGMLALDYQRQSLVFHNESGAREIDVDRREPLEAMWSAFLGERKGVSSAEALATLRLALKTQPQAVAASRSAA